MNSGAERSVNNLWEASDRRSLMDDVQLSGSVLSPGKWGQTTCSGKLREHFIYILECQSISARFES